MVKPPRGSQQPKASLIGWWWFSSMAMACVRQKNGSLGLPLAHWVCTSLKRSLMKIKSPDHYCICWGISSAVVRSSKKLLTADASGSSWLSSLASPPSRPPCEGGVDWLDLDTAAAAPSEDILWRAFRTDSWILGQVWWFLKGVYSV